METKIAIIGLGYVGLPLAVALSNSYKVVGYDISKNRIEELISGHDRTHEIEDAILKKSSLQVSDDVSIIHGADIFIVTVPTPVDSSNAPDLTPLEKASTMLGKIIKKGNIIVFESTVYPGVTEDFCGPILEKLSGLRAGKDFFLGYSPERINPGDKVHTVDKITKVVAGQTLDVEQKLAEIYGKMNGNNIFVAKSIKAAEAAKVIENTQRDINIAFMNEISLIFSKMNISIYDVLDAASTKWNFLKFLPGLVGGHCIGVDPYYLATASKALGHDPRMILAGRSTNESMANELADLITQRVGRPMSLLMLGLTFKENVPDLRNTKVVDLIEALKKRGHHIDVHDDCADPQEASRFFGYNLTPTLSVDTPYDGAIGAVAHDLYCDVDFNKFLKPQGWIFDLKAIWRKHPPKGFNYWTL